MDKTQIRSEIINISEILGFDLFKNKDLSSYIDKIYSFTKSKEGKILSFDLEERIILLCFIFVFLEVNKHCYKPTKIYNEFLSEKNRLSF